MSILIYKRCSLNLGSNRGIKKGMMEYNVVISPVCFCLPLETYHIRLSSIINIIIPELFESSEKITDRNYTVVTCRTAGDSTI
jgi:hypothetical protein